MYYNENSSKVKCQYLRDNPDVDEVACCPRMLHPEDKKRLLDALSEDIISYGEKLNKFILSHDDVDFSPYFDYFYNDLSRCIRRADDNLHLCSHEPSFV